MKTTSAKIVENIKTSKLPMQIFNSTRLSIDGDDLERHYWGLFIKDQFPNYESFWLKFVVPLTNRPDSVYFKADAELKKIGKNKSDLCIAQLNYSILRHLIRAFEILKALENPIGMDQQLNLLQEGIVRLVGAQDNAFELLERFSNPKEYRPFEEGAGEKARRKKYDKKSKGYPLQQIRDYRNSLVHGRLLPGIMDGNRLCLPKIGKENLYLDWRIVTDFSNISKREKAKKNFFSVLNILTSAWRETIEYLENNWKKL